ncbi:MAG: hypothetical protein JXR30_04110 [Alphaproteobacteria bacterium]|nr:hypothetical protein [Alphaproteobacteria bacterium]
MKFKLIYKGEVKIHPKRRAHHIHDIRMKLDCQLKRLTEIPPYSKLQNYIHSEKDNKKTIVRTVSGIEFVPIISPELNLLAELEVQILHPELLGTPRADIDNRMKTLLDALRRPQDIHEVPEDAQRGQRIYTLLDDDHLVTKITVNTSHWLANRNPEDLLIIITVNIRASRGTLENLDFIV